MKILLSITLLIIGFITSGCSTLQLSKEDATKIDAIKLNAKIDVPEKALFQGGASNFQNLGWLGPAIAAFDRPNDVVLTDFLKNKKIDIREIVYGQFLGELKNTILSSKIKEKSDHEITLSIVEYGLRKGWGFSNDMRPSVKILATMSDQHGNIVWKQEAFVGGATTELPIHPLEEWVKDPEALKDGFVMASKLAVSSILKDFELKELH
ncbi:hypothetical protein H8L32_02975 [Undibacterium sp. CY18W]|uniref:ABC-type transport auxiliary lipoprotein component domain-containing protein n=1 Tax=Undibacterium hunanense TaxID=2762292 RepID=A0ABR6ZKM7_9BURK|nr:hypothetical protein [Undibacterium hunanense]MBC3916442.1 hypothetical protein [Undibacterium hunanense]